MDNIGGRVNLSIGECQFINWKRNRRKRMSKRVECQNLSIGKEIGGKECLKELSVDRYQ